jgi:hypothetical protein
VPLQGVSLFAINACSLGQSMARLPCRRLLLVAVEGRLHPLLSYYFSQSVTSCTWHLLVRSSWETDQHIFLCGFDDLFITTESRIGTTATTPDVPSVVSTDGL